MSTEAEMMNDAESILPDLSDEPVRRRLGTAGWKAFRRIMSIWQAPKETASRLLGLAPEADLDSVDPESTGWSTLGAWGIDAKSALGE